MTERETLYARELSRLIKYETISYYDMKEPEKFEGFHRLLKEVFPSVFEKCVTENFDGSLLIKWEGKSKELPILFMNHHDVVEATGEWKHDPFGGFIEDGRLWGRGTLDTKGGLYCMLRAAQELIDEGFVPERDIYFESACTEETDGSGADKISKILRERDIRFLYTLDEGGMMLHDPIGGADGDFAMVGMGEKGCADLKFVARSSGGHASTPGKDTPLVRLGKFMAAAESSGIFKTEMSKTVEEMLRRLAPTMSGPLKAVFASPTVFRHLITGIVPSVSATAGAMFKTTLAFTMAHGSEGLNVLPDEAYVTGNMRYSHHQGRDDSIDAIRRLAKKFDIETEIIDGGIDSPVTDYNGSGFKEVERAVKENFPGVITVPYIMTGASDSRYFKRNSDQNLRFAPFMIDDEQLKSIHGYDENIKTASLPPAVDFYKTLMKGERK